jgi:hypothetical protein
MEDTCNMKSLLIALCMLPIISLAQMKHCEITTKDSTSFLIFKDFHIVTHPDGTTKTLQWFYSKTNREDTHTYYIIQPGFNTKMVFNEKLRSIKYFYNYQKEMDNYIDVVSYTY